MSGMLEVDVGVDVDVVRGVKFVVKSGVGASTVLGIDEGVERCSSRSFSSSSKLEGEMAFRRDKALATRFAFPWT